MPPEQNVDVVREAWDAWLRGDVNDMFALLHPEITWTEMEWAQISTLRDGKIIRIDNPDDRSKAFEVAGLRD